MKKPPILLLLLLGAFALAASAEDGSWPPGPEQRRELRERWRQASPEERMALWQRFQERMRQRQMRQFGMPGRPDMNPMDYMNMGSDFGAGFEQRKNEESPGDQPVASPHFWHGRGKR